MQKRINHLKGLRMEIKDVRNMRYEPHLKKPYYLYVEWGNRNFYFSNRNKAERWLKKYKKHTQELYREMFFLFSDLYAYNVRLSDVCSFANMKPYRNDFPWGIEHYHLCIAGFRDFESGTEINSLYHLILKHLSFYSKLCRKSNRHRSMYEDIRHKIKQTKRLYREYELLVCGQDGIKEITTDETTPLKVKYINKVSIPA